MLAVNCSRKARCDAVNALERRQLDHRFDAILKENRQHDDVARHRLEQARTDRHGVMAALR